MLQKDNISICITLKNRASYLDKFCYDIQFQNYDLKNNVELCITDGNSNDNLFEIIEKWKHLFLQIKYAKSDRSVLPFKILTNNPVCDRNAQIMNVATFEKCLITDAECLFESCEQLKYIVDKLDDKNLCIYHGNISLGSNYVFEFDGKKKNLNDLNKYKINSYDRPNGLGIGFNKSLFKKCGGFDEQFVFGYAYEDSYFIEYCIKNFKVEKSPLLMIHQWHPRPPRQFRQLHSVNQNLSKKYLSINHRANNNVVGWERSEMINDIKIFK